MDGVGVDEDINGRRIPQEVEPIKLIQRIGLSVQIRLEAVQLEELERLGDERDQIMAEAAMAVLPLVLLVQLPEQRLVLVIIVKQKKGLHDDFNALAQKVEHDIFVSASVTE